MKKNCFYTADCRLVLKFQGFALPRPLALLSTDMVRDYTQLVETRLGDKPAFEAYECLVSVIQK